MVSSSERFYGYQLSPADVTQNGFKHVHCNIMFQRGQCLNLCVYPYRSSETIKCGRVYLRTELVLSWQNAAAPRSCSVSVAVNGSSGPSHLITRYGATPLIPRSAIYKAPSACCAYTLTDCCFLGTKLYAVKVKPDSRPSRGFYTRTYGTIHLYQMGQCRS